MLVNLAFLSLPMAAIEQFSDKYQFKFSASKLRTGKQRIPLQRCSRVFSWENIGQTYLMGTAGLDAQL